ncbi:MAG TPA: amidohydrolase family protein, partial [Oleiagrimonas sp.]|nr:amidohydrolase family protein [Oleiagrimonas sp.]
VCDTMLPTLADERLVDGVDAFCENIGFSLAETRRVFERARELGLPVKLHAEQLSNQNGAALVAEFGGLSADHLEHLDEAGIQAMATAGTAATLLPGAFYALRDTHLPPVDLLRKHNVPIAIATDLNPGTSPMLSLRLAMSMATTLFRLTPEEALRGATAHAARALGLDDRGTLDIGKRADMVVWGAREPAELAYWIGGGLARQIIVDGQLIVS